MRWPKIAFTYWANYLWDKVEFEPDFKASDAWTLLESCAFKNSWVLKVSWASLCSTTFRKSGFDNFGLVFLPLPFLIQFVWSQYPFRLDSFCLSSSWVGPLLHNLNLLDFVYSLKRIFFSKKYFQYLMNHQRLPCIHCHRCLRDNLDRLKDYSLCFQMIHQKKNLFLPIIFTRTEDFMTVSFSLYLCHNQLQYFKIFHVHSLFKN